MRALILLFAMIPSLAFALDTFRESKVDPCDAYKTKLEEIFKAKLNGDIATFLGALSDDVVWEMEASTLPWGGKYVGKAGEQGLEGFFGKVGIMKIDAHSWQTQQMTCDAVQRRVVVQGAEGIHNVEHPERRQVFNINEVWQFGEDGKITGFHGYLDTAKFALVL